MLNVFIADKNEKVVFRKHFDQDEIRNFTFRNFDSETITSVMILWLSYLNLTAERLDLSSKCFQILQPFKTKTCTFLGDPREYSRDI